MKGNQYQDEKINQQMNMWVGAGEAVPLGLNKRPRFWKMKLYFSWKLQKYFIDYKKNPDDAEVIVLVWKWLLGVKDG